MKKSTTKALDFLSSRNPLDDYLSREQYVFKLMDYITHKGEEALEALAGFYLYSIRNLKGEECTHAIRSTFAHDLGGMKDEWMSPRSSSYLDIWKQELNK